MSDPTNDAAELDRMAAESEAQAETLPGYWRVHDSAIAGVCYAVGRILDGQDGGGGVASDPWESTRRRLLAAVADVARLTRERDAAWARSAARDYGEHSGEFRKPESDNPHPYGSDLYCDWQNGYWGARAHRERAAALRALYPDAEPPADADVGRLVAGLVRERDALYRETANNEAAWSQEADLYGSATYRHWAAGCRAVLDACTLPPPRDEDDGPA